MDIETKERVRHALLHTHRSMTFLSGFIGIPEADLVRVRLGGEFGDVNAWTWLRNALNVPEKT